MAEFIVYELVDPTTLDVFYVGKGKQDRPERHIRETQRWIKEGSPQTKYWLTRNTHRLAKIARILNTGLEPLVFVTVETDNETEAFEKEVRLIQYHGLENLVNLTKGGRGNITVCHSKGARERARVSMIGHKQSPETIAKRIAATKGQKRPPLSGTHKQKISEGLKRHGKFGAALLDQTGTKSPRAKLTEDQVLEIRNKYKSGTTQVRLAQEYNLAQSTISRIVLNQVYFSQGKA